MEDELFHYGTPRHSGRYPWGSGENPYQSAPWLQNYDHLKSSGLSETDIAKALNMTTTELRQKRSIASDERSAYLRSQTLQLKQHGYSNTKIGEMLGVSEGTVRNFLKDPEKHREDATNNTKDALRDALKEHKYIDIGPGAAAQLGVSQTRLKTAVSELKKEGYETVEIKVEQATNPGKYTTVNVIAPAGTTKHDVWAERSQIAAMGVHSEDNGETYTKWHYPESIDSKRVFIRYAETGGLDKDGTIEIRRGVEDISLGNDSYDQVRIMVDGKGYMKGMALYSDDVPKGYDIIYNTNRKQSSPLFSDGTPNEPVFKDIKKDPTNPFGTSLNELDGQRWYTDEKTGEKKLSLINKVNTEGKWDDWSKTVASQMLGKQNINLIKRQLALSYDEKLAEYQEILEVTNPTVRKKLLKEFSDGCDTSAVDLKAVAFPRQSTKVILPFSSQKEDEVYAPTYNDGEYLALIRYPHSGTFEIPIVKVNNTQKEARKNFGNLRDAIAIHPSVAGKLSGADFDGDTVVAIPTNDRIKITSSRLKELEGFEPKLAYPYREGMTLMKKANVQTEMGKISNLITDMTIKGANEQEIARAVKHSMVIIDAYKHKLDWKMSEKDNGIAELKAKYQGVNDRGQLKGASTLLSKSKSEERVDERKDFNIDRDTNPETGEKTYRETGRTYTTKTGIVKKYTTVTTKMANASDARELSTGTPKEEVYATYANKLKALANMARKEYISTKDIPYSPAAREQYSEEVASLQKKLLEAESNSPKERQAQLLTSLIIEQKKKDNPSLKTKEGKKDLKKEQARTLEMMRRRVGAKKKFVEIEPNEWAAIQAGALSVNFLNNILNNAKADAVQKLATPRKDNSISEGVQSRIRSMSVAGFTISEIADQLGVSTSTVSKYIK